MNYIAVYWLNVQTDPQTHTSVYGLRTKRKVSQEHRRRLPRPIDPEKRIQNLGQFNGEMDVDCRSLLLGTYIGPPTRKV